MIFYFLNTETMIKIIVITPLLFFSQIQIPVLLLNALDDPLVPEELFVTPHNHVSKYCFLRVLLFRTEARVSRARVRER